MVSDQVVQNQQEAVEFEKDFTNVFDQAREAEAIDFAAQFDAPPKSEKPATDNKGFSMEDLGGGLVNSGEAAIDTSKGIGRDVGLGVLHSPRSIARGVRGGVDNMLSFIDDLHKFNTNFFLGKEPSLSIPHLPEIAANETPTVTGGLIEGVSQFMTGMKGVDKVGKLVGPVKGVPQFLKSMGKGSFADVLAFDKHESRLSNIVEQVPALQNPVTEYLSADPEDSSAEALLKQAIEGAALQGVGDVLFDGVRLLKKGKLAKAQMEAEGSTIDDLFNVPDEEAAGIGLKSSQFEFLGDAESDDLFIRKQKKLNDAGVEVDAAFGKEKAIKEGANPAIDDYEINFARIDGPDDIKQLMDDMVNNEALKPSIEEARRGKRDARETLTAATDIDGFDELLSRRTGDAFNAETIVAARKVYYDTTTKLMDAAKRAASPDASDIDQFNFRKMVAMHHAVQKEFMGVRAEAGRALQAWNIPLAGGGAENLRAMEQVLNEFGGVDASKDLAKRLAVQGNNLNTTQINAITTKATGARTLDAVSEAWTLGLLTNPTTHVVNVSSNVLTQFVLGGERLMMAGVKDSPVTLREGAEFFTAIMESQKMALKNAAQAFRTGQTGHGLSKLDLPRTRATARDILDPDGKAGIASKALDGWGAILGKYVGGSLAAGDEYSKTVLYQAQVRSLAVREGIAQGLTGGDLQVHVARVLADPPAAIRADAVTFANYGTFTKELGKTGQDVQRIIARHPALRFVAPFVRTPANIFKFTYERTPLAPLSKKIRDDIGAGGVRKASALAKIGMGTSIMAIGADFSQNGKITGAGPNDPDTRSALRRTGWQPYSVKVGDTWYSYARFEPVATVLGMSADLAEIMSNYESYEIAAQQDVESLVTAVAIASGNQVVGKTFMSGFADLTEALSDPGRYGEKFIEKFGASFVPAGSAAIERAINPEMEQVFNMMDGVKSRIPGFSETVSKRRNIWGEEISYFTPNEKDLVGATAERVMSLFNPVYYSQEKDAPVDRWMLKNGFEINMPQKQQVFDGVKIDLQDHPEIYDRLVDLRGQGLDLQRYGNQDMKSFFQNLASEEDPFGRHVGFFMALGNNFDDQQAFINKVVRDYNDGAKNQLLDEYPELSDIITRERRKAMTFNEARPPIEQIITQQPEQRP